MIAQRSQRRCARRSNLLKAVFKLIGKKYFLSAWLPSALAVLFFAVFYFSQLNLKIDSLGWPSFYAVILSLGGLFVSAIVQFVKGRKLYGAANLVSLTVIAFLFVGSIGALMFENMFSDEPDNFGKDIVIPADMKISDPVESFDEVGGPVSDELTQEIIAAFSTTNMPAAETKISTDLSVLAEFGSTNRQKLVRYLSSSPKWFVTEERGKPYAYRRLIDGGKWKNELNGYFTDFEVAPSTTNHFQTRIIIGFDGPVFDGPFSGRLTAAKIGSGMVPIRVVEDKALNQGKESYFVLRSPGAAVEIFEQSRMDARPLTQIAIADIKKELEMALKETNDATASGQILSQTSEPKIELANGMQGGIYQVRAFVNPGEAGKVYLKVFEATRNTPLSEDRIKPISISQIGWSSNPKEMFRYQSEITVYEGDWGTYYPGRFELWFVPESGKPERKLIERIFRIEGWMR
jgi:hypothetical protein